MIFTRRNKRFLKRIFLLFLMANNEKSLPNEDPKFMEYQDRHQKVLDDIRQDTMENIKNKSNFVEIREIILIALSMAKMKMGNSHIKSNYLRFLKTDDIDIDDTEKGYQDYLAKCNTIKLQQYVAFEDLKIDLKQFLQKICLNLEQEIDKEEL